MTYTHTSIALPCEVDTFCADCENPLPKGSPARRRVTNISAPVFREEWICGGTCGPIIDDVSDHALMRKRIAQLEEDLLHAQQDAARLVADFEDAEQQRDVFARQYSELSREHNEVSREMMKARKQAADRDALKHTIEQISEVATATYTKLGARAHHRLELIIRIIADAKEADQ